MKIKLNVSFPFVGLFNVCNKVLVGLDILLEWREAFKEGFPLTNIITVKIKGLLHKIKEVNCFYDVNISVYNSLLWGNSLTPGVNFALVHDLTPVTVHTSFLLPWGNFERQVTWCTTLGVHLNVIFL